MTYNVLSGMLSLYTTTTTNTTYRLLILMLANFWQIPEFVLILKSHRNSWNLTFSFSRFGTSWNQAWVLVITTEYKLCCRTEIHSKIYYYK